MVNRRQIFLLFFFIVFAAACDTLKPGKTADIRIETDSIARKSNIIINGRLFTSFCWPENVYKPVLYPVFTASGTEITRGFPLRPRMGEQVDHIHQVGIWLNYGNVNGLDFWGNGYRGIKEPKGGVIRHNSIERVQSRNGVGSFVSQEDWLKPSGEILLKEKSEYYFSADSKLRIIDRVTRLTAQDTDVVFKDTKEGMFAIRVARQLELPSRSGVILIDSANNPSRVKDTMNCGVSGNYRSSEGIEGEAVWGTRAKWMSLSGKIGDEDVSIVICDHPKNPGYPAYWHARGYGLFSVNPLGWKDFTKGKEVFNFIIPAKKTAIFRYRVMINSGKNLSDEEINNYLLQFGKKYKK